MKLKKDLIYNKSYHLKNKKAIQTHILIVLITAFIITSLLVTLLSSFFKADNQNCRFVHYDIEKTRISGKSVLVLDIKNKGNRKIFFSINKKLLSEPLLPKRKLTYRTNIKKGIKTANVVPIIKDLRGNTYECKGKSKSINLNVVLKNG